MLRIYKVSEASAQPSRLAIDEAARELRAGSLALIPTETVYGIGVSVRACVDTMHAEPAQAKADWRASAHAAARGRAAVSCASASAGEDPAPDEGAASIGDAASIEGAAPIEVNGQLPPAPSTGYGRIFTLKQRELTQTVPWLVDGPAALDRYGTSVAPELRVLAEAFWPGALTIVVPAAPSVPAFMRAADGTVALRSSASPVVQELVRACGSPLAVTSANTHGAPAPAAFSEVEPRVLAGVDVAIDAGATPCRDASTIVAMRAGAVCILRQGALSSARIQAALDASAHSTENGGDHGALS